MSVIINENMSVQKKLEVLSDAAKYDVACTSSGVDRKGMTGGMGNSVACGICHSFSEDGRCISLLKILFTNECIFDCKYCSNRSSNDTLRATFTPEEVCNLTMEFYRRNYIEGLFLSSGVLRNPNYTMELLCTTLRMLREVHHFNGYIHCKAVPGADSSVIEMTGWYADRMSVNLELPTAEGLRTLAPHKNRKSILRPMKQIQVGRQVIRNGLGYEPFLTDSRQEEGRILLSDTPGSSPSYGEAQKSGITIPAGNIQGGGSIVSQSGSIQGGRNIVLQPGNMQGEGNIVLQSGSIQKERNTISLPNMSDSNNMAVKEDINFGLVKRPSINRGFVPAGQSTQMIVGATPENDYQIISVAEALYQKFDLKRVFYSAYIPINFDSMLPAIDKPPLLREHRLYQADWLLRFYGFTSGELLSEERPNFNVLLDPKCNWALGHLENFPVEINKADYYTLLRVPGIGVRSAQRIVKARRHGTLDFPDLKKIGVVLKRAVYFITCSGKMMYQLKIEEDFITNQLVHVKERLPLGIGGSNLYKQISLFDDVNFTNSNKNQNIYN